MMNTMTPPAPIVFASSVSTLEHTPAAIDQAGQAVLDRLGGPPDLAFLFVTSHHRDACEALAIRACDRLKCEAIFGATAESLVATGREIENEPGLSLWAARLPRTQITPLHLEFQRTADGGSIVGWPDETLCDWPRDSSLLLLGEPFSFPADSLLERMNEDHPGVPVIGGMASGGHQPAMNRLIVGRKVVREGAVGVLLAGGMKLRTVVSQGCRPIGRPFIITRAERNIIHELGGKPPLLLLQQLFAELPTREQQLVQTGLHLGRVVSEYADRFEPGDFLVRNVMGIDKSTGAIAVGDYFRTGQTVQFHVRDAQTADDDLRRLLNVVKNDRTTHPRGGLLFTCNGRGSRLFDAPHHDAAAVAKALGDIPLAGFFAAGEIGPIGGANAMHGFTASLALFEPDA